MQQKVFAGVFLITVVVLLWRGQLQQQELERLAQEVATLKGQAQGEVGADSAAPVSPGAAAAAAPSDTRTPPRQTTPRAADAGADEPAMIADVPSLRQPERPRPADDAREQLLEVLESDDPQLKQRVQAVLDEAQEARRDERRELRQERWESRAAERLEALAQEVSLNPQQQDALFTIMTVARDRSAEAFRAARDNGDFRAARDEANKATEAARSEARQLLSDKQFEAFDAMLEEARGGGERARRRF